MSLLSGLCNLTFEEEIKLRNDIDNRIFNDKLLNKVLGKEVKEIDFDIMDLNKAVYIKESSLEPRMNAQNGAFILFGLPSNDKLKKIEEGDFNRVSLCKVGFENILICNKSLIRKQLKNRGVDNSYIFPNYRLLAKKTKEKLNLI